LGNGTKENFPFECGKYIGPDANIILDFALARLTNILDL
jgi:hypothetical protein